MVEIKTAREIMALIQDVEADTGEPRTYLDRCIAVTQRKYARVQDIRYRLIMISRSNTFMVAKKGEEKSMLQELIDDLS